MKKFVVTITRQFGSLGRPIARELATRLGVEFYDRDIVEQVSRRMELPVSVISKEEERAKTGFFYMRFPLGTETTATQDMIFDVQKDLILDLAERQSCIIVGRCSDAVLQNDAGHFGVFIYASYKKRIENCISHLHMTAAEAEKSIEAVDKAREAYHKRYAGFSPWDCRHKNLMIDSGMLGVSGTVNVLESAIREHFAD